jgi:hypothetical protein
LTATSHYSHLVWLPRLNRVLQEVHCWIWWRGGTPDGAFEVRAFTWTPEADTAFLALKMVLMMAHVLQLPDFSVSSVTAMHLGLALMLSSIKRPVRLHSSAQRSPSSAQRSPHIMPSCRHMSVNSLA